jgi:hypothetical protein
MERSAWTDERLDDFATHVDGNFGLLREEIRDLRQDMRDAFRALRSDLSAWQRTIAQIGWALAAALIGAIIALILAVS